MAHKDPVYKLIERTGASAASVEAAVAQAIKRAHQLKSKMSKLP
jgi:flavin-binding protein dodecin